MNKYRNLHTFLISLNLCLFCVILLSKRSCGAHYQYESCVPTNCGGGGSPNVSFPFYIPGRQEHYCSYPGFALNCSENGFPVLHLAERNEYVVEGIFYQNRSIHVYNAAVSRSSAAAAGSCLPRIRNTTLPPSQFDYDHPASLRLFSNCRNPLPEVLSRYNTSCDGSEDEKNWDLALYDTDDHNLRNVAMEICDENVVAPVGLGNSNSNGLVVNVAVVLRKGFLLNWTASDCTECEDSGGRCGFDATAFHFRCFCPDRPHSRSCKPGKKSMFLSIFVSVLVDS